MEALVFVLIIVFAVLNSKGKTPKNVNAAKPAAVKAPARERQAARRRNAAKLRQQLNTLAEKVEQKMDAVEAGFTEPAPAAEPAFAQGVSLADDEGCVGGSMVHVHTEGETHEEHERHMEALRMQDAEETRAAEAASELAEMNLQKLRRAVVMAEVLDRPVALRRGRR